MKFAKNSVAMLFIFACASALAQVTIERVPLGSGNPGLKGNEPAMKIGNDLYLAPQYMPGYPTAAVIYPRVIEVPCQKAGAGLACAGYEWSPKYGRGEYLHFKPVIAQAPVPPTVTPAPSQIIYREIQPRRRDRN